MPTNVTSSHWTIAFRVAMNVLSDRALAEDAAQDTLMRAHRYAANGSVTNLDAWVARVARNVAIDYLRSPWSRRRSLSVEPASRAADLAPAPVEVHRTDGCVDTCLGQLSSTDRRIMARRFVDGASVRQLADELGILPNAAKQRSFRARKRLRECVRRSRCRTEDDGYPALADRVCTPCEGGVPALSAAALAAAMTQLDPAWTTSGGRLRRTFLTDGFPCSLELVAQFGRLAEQEGHYPALTLQFSEVVVELYTAKIDGLTDNDLILAAKIDALTGSLQR